LDMKKSPRRTDFALRALRYVAPQTAGPREKPMGFGRRLKFNAGKGESRNESLPSCSARI